MAIVIAALIYTSLLIHEKIQNLEKQVQTLRGYWKATDLALGALEDNLTTLVISLGKSPDAGVTDKVPAPEHEQNRGKNCDN